MVTRRGCASAALAAAAVMLAGCAPPWIACPAIGYAYAGPVLIDVDPALLGDHGTVEACFGSSCPVSAISQRADGMWVLPLEAPYTNGDATALEPGAVVRVEVHRGGTTFEHIVGVPYKTTTKGFCPGPVEFTPVVLR